MSSNLSIGTCVSGSCYPKGHLTQLDQEALSRLAWELRLVTIMTQDYIKMAKKEGVNVQSQIKDIVKVILDAPSFSDPHQSKGVIYLQQLCLRGSYCSQIIHKLTEHRIRRTAEEARKNDALKSQIDLINACEKWLLERLPEKDIKVIQRPQVMENSCQALLMKMEEMQDKILSNAKKVNRCSSSYFSFD